MNAVNLRTGLSVLILYSHFIKPMTRPNTSPPQQGVATGFVMAQSVYHGSWPLQMYCTPNETGGKKKKQGNTHNRHVTKYQDNENTDNKQYEKNGLGEKENSSLNSTKMWISA